MGVLVCCIDDDSESLLSTAATSVSCMSLSETGRPRPPPKGASGAPETHVGEHSDADFRRTRTGESVVEGRATQSIMPLINESILFVREEEQVIVVWFGWFTL